MRVCYINYKYPAFQPIYQHDIIMILVELSMAILENNMTLQISQDHIKQQVVDG